MLSLSSPGVHFRNDSKAPQSAREVNDGRGLSIEVGNKVHVNVDCSYVLAYGVGLSVLH